MWSQLILKKLCIGLFVESEQAIEMQIKDPLIGIALWIDRIILYLFIRYFNSPSNFLYSTTMNEVYYFIEESKVVIHFVLYTWVEKEN